MQILSFVSVYSTSDYKRERVERVEKLLPHDRQNKILGYHPLDFFYSKKELVLI